MRTGKISLSDLSAASRSYSNEGKSTDQKQSAYDELQKELDRMIGGNVTYSDRQAALFEA